MVSMSPQEMKNFAESIAPKVADPDDDDQANSNLFNRPADRTGDPRDMKPSFDLYKVDYRWVEKETSKRELKGAYVALKEDGAFPDLLAAVVKKLKSIDPRFKTSDDFNKYTLADEHEANADVNAFLADMDKSDKVIRGESAGAGAKRTSGAIFDEKVSTARSEPTQEQLDYVATIENKRSAEDARYRGNEYMKAKEHDEAVNAYTRSIDLNPTEAATYCNRAMAYLRMKNYAKCIEDSNSTLKMEPGYVKAYHRRGKAYLATKKFALAISDFQFILEKSPGDKDINASLKSAREQLEDQEERIMEGQPKTMEIIEDEEEAPPKPATKKGGFKRVAIDEDESSEEETSKKSTTATSNGSTPKKLKPGVHSEVFFDITIGGAKKGRIIMELTSNTPKTSENFRALCVGNKKNKSGRALTYKDSMFHRVIPGFMAQGGDFTHHCGTGGESIYGETFADENFINKHTGRGILSMANAGPGTNGSQFFMCFKSTPHLNNKHVVFGKVTKGLDVLDLIENNRTRPGDKPVEDVKIANCGDLADAVEDVENQSPNDKSSKKKAAAKTAEAAKPKIEEISSTPAKESNWTQKKNSNYDAFDGAAKNDEAALKSKIQESADKQEEIKKQIDAMNELKAKAEREFKEKDDLAKAATLKYKKAQAELAEQEAALKTQGAKVDKTVGSVEKGMENDAAAATSAPPARPSTALNNEKKQRMQPKFDKITAKVEVAKEKAQVEFKKGSYAEAIKLYKNAAEILEIAHEDFSVFKKEIFQLEAAIFGNIAFCYGKDAQDRKQIEFCTKVVDRSLFITDLNVLIKAYLRRGLAYEAIEKYKPAVNDLVRVRELQPMNKQAQQGIQRCQKYIKQDTGENYTPLDEDIALPDLPEVEGQTTAPVTSTPAAATEEVKAAPAKPVVEEKKATEPVAQEATTPFEKEKAVYLAEKKTETPEAEPVSETASTSTANASDSTNFEEVEEKIAALKEKGNNQFRKKAYKEAIKHFSEAINLFESNGRPLDKGDIKTKITQIYTNRCTSLHLLNQQASVASDATFVIEHLDSTNKKALYRRSVAFRRQEKYEEAARDLQVLMKAHGEEDDLKTELKHCMAKMMETKTKAAAAAKKAEQERANAPKIQEVEKPAYKKIQIEEDSSEDSDDADALAKQKADEAAAKKQKARFDQQTLEEATGRAKEEQKERIMSQVPKTAAGFNRDFKAMKKNTEQQMAYMKKIPLATLKGYFVKTEVDTETFSEMMNTLSKEVSSAEDSTWAGDFMLTLAKSFKFDTTIMFVDDEEEAYISKVIGEIRKVDATKADQVQELYED